MTGAALPLWWFSPFLLLVTAVVFRYFMKGYSYIAHLLTLSAALLVFYRFLPQSGSRVLSWLLLAGAVLFTAFEIPVLLHAHTDRDCGRKYLIVLGAEVIGTRPSRSLRYRLEAAQDYLGRFPESFAVVSGGRGRNEEISEAQCMFEQLCAAGISPERIFTEEKAVSTMENLSLSFDIIRSRGDDPDGNTAILSSSYHLFRAKRMARTLNVRAAGVACYPGNPILAANFFIREAFGVAHLLLFRK